MQLIHQRTVNVFLNLAFHLKPRENVQIYMIQMDLDLSVHFTNKHECTKNGYTYSRKEAEQLK